MKKKTDIPLAGYLPLPKLLEINRDALRAMPKAEARRACKQLLREVLGFTTFSNEEAIGLLESTKFMFLIQAEDEQEKHEFKRTK